MWLLWMMWENKHVSSGALSWNQLWCLLAHSVSIPVTYGYVCSPRARPQWLTFKTGLSTPPGAQVSRSTGCDEIWVEIVIWPNNTDKLNHISTWSHLAKRCNDQPCARLMWWVSSMNTVLSSIALLSVYFLYYGTSSTPGALWGETRDWCDLSRIPSITLMCFIITYKMTEIWHYNVSDLTVRDRWDWHVQLLSH